MRLASAPLGLGGGSTRCRPPLENPPSRGSGMATGTRWGPPSKILRAGSEATTGTQGGCPPEAASARGGRGPQGKSASAKDYGSHSYKAAKR